VRAAWRTPLARSALGLTFARAVNGMLVLAGSVAVGRAAGTTSLGVYGLAVTVALYAATIADAGVSQWALPAFARAPRERWPSLWRDVVRFELRSAPLFALPYLAGVALLLRGEMRWALLAAGAYWLMIRFNGLARSLFTVAERVGAETAATTLESVLALALTIVLMAVHPDAALAVLALAAGAAVGLLVRLRGLRRLGLAGGHGTRRARDIAREARPFGGYTILTTLYLRIDVILLSLLVGAHELGLYQPPVRILTALVILPDAIASILLGRASRAPGEAGVRRRQEQVLAIGVPLGLALVVLSAVAGAPLLALLYGDEFRETRLALTLLVATVPVTMLASLNGNGLTAHGRQGVRLACLAIAACVAVTAGIPAILAWGYNGAAAVTLLNELVLAAAYAIGLAATVGRGAIVLPRLRPA
jgi:O-antigen/teichoic acid export membrane protein